MLIDAIEFKNLDRLSQPSSLPPSVSSLDLSTEFPQDSLTLDLENYIVRPKKENPERRTRGFEAEAPNTHQPGITVPPIIACSAPQLSSDKNIVTHGGTDMANDSGFLKIPRSLFTDERLRGMPSSYWMVLITILRNLAYREMKTSNFREPITLQVGQACISLREIVLQSSPDLKKSTVDRALEYLERHKFITFTSAGHKTGRKKTIITLVDKGIYDTMFGSDGTQSGTQAGHKRDTSHYTKKKDKKEKTHTQATEVASALVSFGSHVKLREGEHEKLCQTIGPHALQALIDEMNDYCACSRPEGYKDYAAALRQWNRRRTTPKTSGVDRRTQTVQGKPVESPADGLF